MSDKRHYEVPAELLDFRNFLYLIWAYLWEAGAISAEKPDPTPVQYDIAQYLQKGPRRKVIEAFRGVGKSWITAAYVLWRLLLDPHKNFLVVSASKERSDQFTIFCKRLISEMPLLSVLEPNDNQRNSAIAFDVGPAGISHSPSVKSVGITGQLTGSRADEIVADDIESLNNSLTQTMRDQLSERIKEFDAVIKPGGRITFLGTPQTEMSIYNQMAQRGYAVRIWPARIPKNLDPYNGNLAPMIISQMEHGAAVGTPTDPGRFTNEDLQEREASYGRSGFSLQFMLDTSLSDQDRYPLKLSDLMVMPLDTRMAPTKLVWNSGKENAIEGVPVVGLNNDRFYAPMWHSKDMEEYTGAMMFIDPSGRGSDETGYAITKMLHGWIYLVEAGGLAGGYSPETLQSLAVIAQKHKVNYVQTEPNFGDGMFTELFKPVLRKIYPCTIEEGPRATKQKELRIIDTLEPVMNQHRLVVDMGLIRRDYDTAKDPKFSLFYQMTRITKDKGSLRHDDRLDAVEGAVRYWVEQMGISSDDAIEERRERLLQEDLDRFMDHVVGRPADPYRDQWFNLPD